MHNLGRAAIVPLSPPGRGWRAQRAGRGPFFERNENQFQYALGVLQYVVIPETWDLKALRFQPGIKRFIPEAFRMLAAINFHDEFAA